jgi:hypothetical protein
MTKDWLGTFLAIPQGKRVAHDVARARAGFLGYLARRRTGIANQMTPAIRARTWVTRNLWMDLFEEFFQEKHYPATHEWFTANGALLKRALKERRTSQSRLGKLFGVDKHTIRRWLAQCRT